MERENTIRLNSRSKSSSLTQSFSSRLSTIQD